MLLRGKKSDVETRPGAGVVNNFPAKVNGAQAKLSDEERAEVRRRATKSKQLQASVVDIVSLLMRSPQFRNVMLADLENFVVPAVTSGQFMIAEARSKTSGLITPVAAILWASVAAEIDRQLSNNPDQFMKILARDWKSGDIPWLVIATGEQHFVAALMQRLNEIVLKGGPLKSRIAGKDGKVLATVIPFKLK